MVITPFELWLTPLLKWCISFCWKSVTDHICWSCDKLYVGHVISYVAGPGLAYIYINFISLLSFLYSYDRLHINHVTGYVTWPMYISAAFSFGFPSSFFFPSLLFLIYNSSEIPAIASGYLMCGFLNHAVPLHIVIKSMEKGPMTLFAFLLGIISDYTVYLRILSLIGIFVLRFGFGKTFLNLLVLSPG